MDQLRWEKLEDIVDQLFEVPSSDREHLLNKLCENNSQLKSRVLHFLNSIEKSDDFLNRFSESKQNLLTNINDERDGSTEDEFIGRKIDKYQITETVGIGGMGTVYLASRCDGVFDKKVAIKVLRREYAIPTIKLQFKLERQILANLKHPGIGKLYDGGIYEGLPYLVMEYVEGIPIDQYCDENRLTIPARINLFKSVLEIIEYAHKKLVIHRDIKPENILIKQNGDVKILDFGIAQLEKESENASGRSGNNYFLTPKYASPEQMSEDNISTSSDIYSLGTLLQKLLSDQYPYHVNNKRFEEIQDMKVSGPPLKASLKYSELPEPEKEKIAQLRNTKPSKLKKLLSSDLDDILLKSLWPDQKSRYSTVGQFLSDLNAYQQDFPVLAKKSSIPYKVSKFIKRNIQPLSAAAAIIIFIAFAATYSFNQIKTEHNIALAEMAKAEEMSGFLIELFEAADPTINQSDDIKARDLLYHGLDRTDNISDPEIRAGILTVMGDALTKISDFETAENVLKEAVEENKNAFGENSIPAADAIYALGLKHSKNHMWHLALPKFQMSHEIYSNHLDDNNRKVLSSLSKLGIAMLNTGDADSAQFYSERAYQRMKETHAQKSPELLEAMNDYASYLGGRGSYQQAIEILNEVIESFLEIGTPDDYRLASPYNRLAMTYKNLENYPLAEEYYKKSLEISKKNLGDDHLFTRTVRMNLITPLFELEKFDEADYHFERNIELMRQRYSENHWRTGSAYGAYGAYQIMRGNYEKAYSLFNTNLSIYQEAIGPGHIWTAYVEGALAATNRFLNNHSVADSLYTRHLEIFKDRYPDFNNDHIGQIRRLIRMYENAEGDYDDVIEEYSALLE